VKEDRKSGTSTKWKRNLQYKNSKENFNIRVIENDQKGKQTQDYKTRLKVKERQK